jgi:hypothetical protein
MNLKKSNKLFDFFVNYDEKTLKENLKKYPISFFDKHNIRIDELSYMGRGDFGEAYLTDDNKILKKTKSRNEYDVSKMVMNKDNLEHVAQVYDTVEFDGYFYEIGA